MMKTIDIFHKNQMKYFNEIKTTTIPNLQQEIKNLEYYYSIEIELEKKLLFLDKIKEIKNKIKSLKKVENEYLLKNMNFLEIYYNNIQDINSNNNKKSNCLFSNNSESFIENNIKNFWNSNGYPQMNYFCENRCKTCNLEMVFSEEGYICKKCCHMNINLISQSQEVTIDRIYTTSYLRLSYFKKNLNQLNGRSTMKIKPHVIQSIKNRIEVEKIEIITFSVIKELLKKLKLKKYNDQIIHIMSLLGINIVQMPESLIDKLCIIFQSLQIPFQKHCPIIRSNFFPYNFLIYKLLLHLGENQYIHHIPNLKNIEKNQKLLDLFEKCIHEITI